ncbi:MAG: TonB family protein [Gemmatimonadales bacterium]
MTQRHSADIKTSHFLTALGLATILHLSFLHLVSLAPRHSAEKEITIIRMDLAALGEPEEVEEVRALPPKVIPKRKPEVEPPPLPQSEPEFEPEPEVKLPPSPQPEPLTNPRAQELPGAAISEPVSPRPRKGITEGVLEGRTQDPEELNRYLTKLFRMIDAKKRYPSQSLRRGEQGTVTVRLTLAADGTLLDVRATTRRPRRLVAASLKAVRDAAPFPPLPKALNRERTVFKLPVVYRIR